MNFFYELTKKEEKEVLEIERKIFYPNGFPKQEVIEKNPSMALRLEHLYLKRNELALASSN